MIIKVRGQIVHSLGERIKRNSMVDEASGCWNWIGAKKDRRGYGSLTIGTRGVTRRTISAHRASYIAFVGDIPNDMHVCHHCDNPACVNPKHLFIGTRQDNTDDRERKGRNKVQYGESNGQSKLREVDVISMRRLRMKGLTYNEIAERFGVSKRTTLDAIKGRNWKHVLPAPPKEEAL